MTGRKPGRGGVGMGDGDRGGGFGLSTQVLGGLPIINAVMDRLGLPALLAAALPAGDARLKLPPAAAVRLVVANLVLGREPLYGLGEWAARRDPALLGLAAGQVAAVNDDRVGRALEALFDADRASLLTAAVLAAQQDGASALPARRLAAHGRPYDELIAEGQRLNPPRTGKRGRPAPGPAGSLLDRLATHPPRRDAPLSPPTSGSPSTTTPPSATSGW